MTIIEVKDGSTYNLEQLGIRTRDIVISSPTYKHYFEEIEGANGLIDCGTAIGPRYIKGLFKFIAENLNKYSEKRNEVFKIFNSKESFYLIDLREPTRKWEVKCNSSFSPEKLYNMGNFEIDFVCAKGLAESNSQKVMTFDTSTFTLLVESDEAIDPRRLPLIIEFKGASTNLKIKNIKTNEEWSYTGTTTVSDTVLLDGIRSTKNGLSIFRNTNRKLISLFPGDNPFQITGATGYYTVTFKFKNYTL